MSSIVNGTSAVHFFAPMLNASNLAASSKPAPTPTRVASPDAVKLTSAPLNPYQGIADTTAQVTVDKWKQGPNDSLEHILLNQGYSMDEIYRKSHGGSTLIEKVAHVNGLRDPNLVVPRKDRPVLVPVKGKAAQAAQPAPTQAEPAVPPQPAQPAQAEAAQQAQPAQTETAQQAQPAQTETAQPAAQQAQPAHAEAVQPVAQQIHPAQAEAQPVAQPAQTEAAAQTTAPAKKHHFFHLPHFGHKPAVPAETAPPAPAETAPTPTQAALAPAAAVAPPSADNVEVGLLLDGLKQKHFNRDEFRALNSAANQYTELRARYSQDGLNAEETQQLAQVQQQYGQMYARFSEGDHQVHIRFTGGDSPDPAARFRAQQNEAAGGFYDDYSAGRLDDRGLTQALLAQRASASQLGSQR